MAANHDEPELIESVISELDSSTFALALIGGAVIGGFLLYLFMQRDKIVKPATQEDEEARLISLAERVAERIEIKYPEASQEASDDDSEQAVDSPWAPPSFMQQPG